MTEEDIYRIKLVEENIFEKLTTKYSEFRKFEHIWIKKNKYPVGLFLQLKNIPGVRSWPIFSVKRWGRFIIEILQDKKSKTYTLPYLLGTVLGWYFLEKTVFPFKSHFIIMRSSRVLIYRYQEKQYLIKLALPKELLKKSLQNEAHILNTFYKLEINNPNIFVPQVLADHSNEEPAFIKQELILGKTLHFFNNTIKENAIHQVFQFLLPLYLENIFIESPKELIDSNRMYKLLDYLSQNKSYSRLQQYIYKIFNKNLCLVKTWTHNDLGTGNIIIDRENKIWLIDWGAAGINYVVNDLDNTVFSEAKIFYQLLLSESGIKVQEIYNYEEQVFIKKIDKLSEILNEGKNKERQFQIAMKNISQYINDNKMEFI